MASRHPGHEAHLATEGPFDLLGTVRLLQRRANHPVERWVDGGYQRVHETAHGWVEVRVEDRGGIDRPDLRLRFPLGTPVPSVERELTGRVRRTLGLDRDVSAFWREAREIPGLADLAHRMRGMRPPRFSGLLEAILSTVPFQQMSLDAGMAVFVRFLERVQPEGAPAPVFPRPDALAKAPASAWDGVGLSGAKARAIHEAAAAISTGAIDDDDLERLPTWEAAAKLKSLRGIGPWSAHLILLRGYGRLDAFPPKDAGVKRGLEAILGREIVPEEWSTRFGALAGMSYFVSLGAALLRTGLIPEEQGPGRAT